MTKNAIACDNKLYISVRTFAGSQLEIYANLRGYIIGANTYRNTSSKLPVDMRIQMNDMPVIIKINGNYRCIPALPQFIGFNLIKRA